MHHSDTLVLGPLPIVERSIRLPLTAVFIALLVMLLGCGAVVAVLARPPLQEQPWPRSYGRGRLCRPVGQSRHGAASLTEELDR